MIPKTKCVTTLLVLLFAGFFSNCAFGGVIFGPPGTSEESAIASSSSENPAPYIEATDQGISMTVADIDSAPQISVANSSQTRTLLEEVSEPVVFTLIIDSPDPLPMELLKIPISDFVAFF